MMMTNTHKISRIKNATLCSLAALGIATSSMTVVTQDAQALVLARTDSDMVLGIVFLFVFFPLGLILDEGGPEKIDWVSGLYEKLPFLKGTPEGKKIEDKVADLLSIIKTETLNETNDSSDEAMHAKVKEIIKKHPEWNLDESKKTFAVRLEEKWVKTLLAENEFSDKQVKQAISILTTF